MFTFADSIRTFRTVSELPGMSEANRKAVLEYSSRAARPDRQPLQGAGEMRGSIRRRGVNSFELRFDLDRVGRQTPSRSVPSRAHLRKHRGNCPGCWPRQMPAR